MTRKLTKIPLKYEPAHEHMLEQLNEGNKLSHELRDVIDFNTGEFFTLLPLDIIDQDMLYSFKGGLVMPPNPVEKIIKFNKTWKARRINDIDEELSAYLVELTLYNPNFTCIFEDATHKITDQHANLARSDGLVYSGEVYYKINSHNCSKDKMLNAVQESNSTWHYLNVLTTTDINSSCISASNIHEIALQSQLVIVCAYDREGYLLWKKNDAEFKDNYEQFMVSN